MSVGVGVGGPDAPAARVAAVVLAAGRGERLGGVAKAALIGPDGRSFLAAVVAAARAGGAARVVVVVAAPFATEVRALAATLGVDAVVDNPRPERGMASSFVAGLGALPADVDVALCWPVDHAAVRTATVTAITRAATRDGLVVPQLAGRGGHPTAFGAALWPACRAAVTDAPDGLRAVRRAHGDRVHVVPVDDPGVCADVDTLGDWAKIQ